MNQHLSEQLEEKSTLNAAVNKLLDNDAIKELWYNNCYLIDQGEVDAVMESFTFEASYVTPYDKGWVEEPFIEGVPGELKWQPDGVEQ